MASMDDFSMTSWHFSWDFMNEEVIDFFREFYEQGRFVKSLNANLLVLFQRKGVTKIWEILGPSVW